MNWEEGEKKSSDLHFQWVNEVDAKEGKKFWMLNEL